MVSGMDVLLCSDAALLGCGRSDAAPGLGDAGDLGGQLRRPLGEQLVELFDRHTRGHGESSHVGGGTLLLVLVAHELHHLPVAFGELGDSRAGGDLGRHGLGPLAGIGEEPLGVHRHRGACVGRRRGHLAPPCGVGSGRSASACFPVLGMSAPTNGMSRPGRMACQYSCSKARLPRWLRRASLSSGKPTGPGKWPGTGSSSSLKSMSNALSKPVSMKQFVCPSKLASGSSPANWRQTFRTRTSPSKWASEPALDAFRSVASPMTKTFGLTFASRVARVGTNPSGSPRPAERVTYPAPPWTGTTTARSKPTSRSS